MINLEKYNKKEKIYSGERTIIYRAIKESTPVIIKVLQDEYPSTSNINAFKQEYEMLRSIEGDGIVQLLGIEKYGNNFAIVFKDIGAIALSILLKDKGKYSLSESLTIMIKIANALGEIHNQKIIHRDIKPHNIVLNENTGKLNIIDFGTASLLPKQNSFIPLSSSIEGTLAYISPEQTGRMNRPVDYRTDFYSLGITYYQLITGELPFLYSNPMELVHAHIAKAPVTPFSKNGTPKVISNIIMKLLEKNPDDRYQSISGLVHDLEWCKDNINTIYSSEFQIGEKDNSRKFQIPNKLYGRTKEILRIVKAFKRISTGDIELITISGRSGIGKSALVDEVKKSLVEQIGYFCSGKYEVFNKVVPYQGLSQCFTELIESILMEDSASILKWKDVLLEELAGNGKLVINIVPLLEKLIGPQPSLDELSATESQERFDLIFQKFIKVFCKKEHPLVIFLDDVQFADSASLTLIQKLLSDSELKYLMIILAIRQSEILPETKFSLALRNWLKGVSFYKPILLEPISKFDVNHLVTDTLGHKEDTCKELVDILYEKTDGNPFYVKEVFKNLYDKGCIYFSDCVWKWDIDTIRNVIRISENVVSIMVEKIKKLPEDNIITLKLAACIGDWFRISVFADILNLPKEDSIQKLRLIISEGLMTVRGNSLGFVQDEVREAIYTMMLPEEKSFYHHKIGSFYLKNARDEDIESQVYTIVEHLNFGIEHVITESEKNRLLDLNTLMGNNSMALSDYPAALNFFKVAFSLLSENSWKTNYKKSLDTYSNLALSEYLNANFSEADRHYEIIYANCKSLLDKTPIIKAQIKQKTIEGKGDEAFDLGFKLLTELGFNMPNHRDMNEVDKEFFLQIGKYEELRGVQPILDLFGSPEMQDEKSKEVISLINTLGDTAIVFKPELLGLISILGVNLSLQLGNTNESAISYMMWGVITNLYFKDYKSGYELGQLGLELSQKKFTEELILCKALAFYVWNINHWVKPIEEDFEISQKGYMLSTTNNDLVLAAYFILLPIKTSFFMGMNLDEVADYVNKALSFYDKYKISLVYTLTLPSLFITLALQGKTESLTSFQSPTYNEEIYLNTHRSIGLGLAYFYLRKFQLYYIANEYLKCIEILPEVLKYFPNIPPHISFSEFHFYNALVLLELNSKFTLEEKTYYEPKFTESYEYLKLWANLCEKNFLHQFLLVEAEKARVENRVLDAIDFYDKSIANALLNDFTNDLALACELSGKYFMELGKPKLAQVYILDAIYYYYKWGALAKVKQLEKKYPEFKKKVKIIPYLDMTSSINKEVSITTIGANTMSGSLDMDSLMKASQAISSEIELGKLLEKMIRILLENAGAEKGFFILKEQEKWYIEAVGNGEEIKVLQAIPLDGYLQLSTKIVNYVIHTKNIILLNDATNFGIFVNDPYIKTNHPKSILCSPISNQGNLVGILYLENNLTSDAFTRERIQILKVLSSQIAFSIENAILYSHLEAKVDERTKDLSNALTNVNSLLKEVTVLKEKQDADYFLTTLLVEPFGKNKAESENIEIEFLVKQKKVFTFRNTEHEIGGDINISDTIHLQGKKFVVFLNGDAMGKSIQGAGGVIVLGTLFKSIIQRTKLSPDKSIYPEKWLKNAFIEMYHAFTGFDGAMIVSAIFGLVDELSGIVYFINADHPNMVLYRNRKALFIPNSQRYKKIGAKGQAEVIRISLFQMLPGDTLILGSDGRDDLVTGIEPETKREIRNLDKNLFLSILEDNGDDLEKIYEGLLTKGNIIDDISLLKIHLKESSGQLKVENTNLDKMLEQLAKYKQDNELEKYIELGQKVIFEYPFESMNLYYLAKALMENKQYEKAIEQGERMRLRQPDHLETLVILIHCYLEIGKKDIAWELFDFLEIYPEDERFRNLELRLRG